MTEITQVGNSGLPHVLKTMSEEAGHIQCALEVAVWKGSEPCLPTARHWAGSRDSINPHRLTQHHIFSELGRQMNFRLLLGSRKTHDQTLGKHKLNLQPLGRLRPVNEGAQGAQFQPDSGPPTWGE